MHHGSSIKAPDNEHTVRRTVNFKRNYSSILSVKPPLSQLHPALNLVRFPPSRPPLPPPLFYAGFRFLLWISARRLWCEAADSGCIGAPVTFPRPHHHSAETCVRRRGGSQPAGRCSSFRWGPDGKADIHIDGVALYYLWVLLCGQTSHSHPLPPNPQLFIQPMFGQNSGIDPASMKTPPRLSDWSAEVLLCNCFSEVPGGAAASGEAAIGQKRTQAGQFTAA